MKISDSHAHRRHHAGAGWRFTSATSENTAARDLAAAKLFAFGGVGAAGIMSQGERNLRTVLGQSDASQQLQAALGHATPAGKLYILVGLRRCDRCRVSEGHWIRWRVLTMTLKSRVDA